MVEKILRWWTALFVVWVVVFSLAAWFVPAPFSLLKPGIAPGLGIIMFGMGVTLLPADFARVARMPQAVVVGVAAQYVIMPLLAIGIARSLDLPPELALGFIILGCCPGGTASNVIAYLARADVALSVTLTAISTLLAVFLTPLLTGWLGSHYLPVDRMALFLDVVKVVLVPVVAGMAIRYWFADLSRRLLPFFPALSVLVIVLIIACVVALSRHKLAGAFGVVTVAVLLHNLLGYSLGYGLATAARLPRQVRRTVAIEVGMQNSGLAVMLASTQFTSPLVALPGTFFSVIHNLTGSALATLWRRGDRGERAGPEPDAEASGAEPPRG